MKETNKEPDKKLKVSEHVIFQLDDSGNWVAYNVFAQTTLAFSPMAMDFLAALQHGAGADELNSRFSGAVLETWEIGAFTNFEGLMADPTRRIRDPQQWPKSLLLDIAGFVALLEKNYILVRNEEEYFGIFKPKTSLLDSKHVGNFHQQLGQKLLVERRVNPEDWWVNQKFNTDRSDLNNTLYKAVQGKFLDDFFSKRFSSSHKVLDIGCGVGYYSKLMGKTGAAVLGIDPNAKYIEASSKNCPANVSFKISEIGTGGSLDWIESASFDFVFMSDALLFYFVSPDPKQHPDINILFLDIRRVLKPNGRFFSMEPHGMFWLRPWLGFDSRPFTILTEYRHKMFNVTPNYSELINSYLKGGFNLVEMKELYADQEFAKNNKRAAGFGNEFPLWWFFELEPK